MNNPALQATFTLSLGTFHLDVDLTADKGEIVGLLGRSGNGKSLTLKTIAGIHTPEKGTITLKERALFDSKAQIDIPTRDRNVGYMFQSYALFPRMTVLQNICCGIKEKEGRKEQAMQWLSLIDMESFANRYPQKLSGGQQQRVALVRMLASKPDLLMLDEPFSALDTESKAQLDEPLLKLLHDYGGPVLFVSHDKAEVERYCSRSVIIEDGLLRGSLLS